MDDLIRKLSEIRSQYNCFNESEEPYYRALSEVIKMLSEQADGDTISREAAIDMIFSEPLYESGMKKRDADEVVPAIYEKIKLLPSTQPEILACGEGELSAQPDQRWIPVSERLPEDEYVLISKKPTKISGDKWSVAIAIRTADPRSRKIQWRDSGFGVIQDDKVLAWMPLPEPYRKGDTE